MKTLIKSANLKIGYSRRQLWVVSFGRLHIFSHPIDAVAFFFQTYIRGYLPTFWARGAFCCDTHRTSWYAAFTWFDRQAYDYRDIGDGPDTWQRITLREWIRLRGTR